MYILLYRVVPNVIMVIRNGLKRQTIALRNALPRLNVRLITVHAMFDGTFSAN